MSFAYSYLCKRGGKKINEDAVEVMETTRGVCAVVADGLGGHRGSGDAASFAANFLIDSYSRDGMRSAFSMQKNLKKVHFAIREKQEKTGGNMQTALAALTIENDTALWCHVGDVRVYHFVNDKLVSYTRDHSIAEAAVCMGQISEDELRFHSDRVRLIRSLGGANGEPEIEEGVSLSGGFHAFLLCTDGFWNYVYEAEMERLLSEAKNPDGWLDDMEAFLLYRAREREKFRDANFDNYSAVAIFYLP